MKNQIFRTFLASIASVAVAQTVNTSLWFNGSNWQVATGGDCVYEYGECEETTMGYWYDYDDRKNDQGGSYVIYPYDTTGYWGSLIGPEIENLGYVTIRYHLADPTLTGQTAEYLYNYIGFGFNVVNGAKDAMDISPTGGLCVTYTSDNAVTLKIAEKTSSRGYWGGLEPSCSVTLRKATTPTMVSKAIEDFKQPTWTPAANKLSSCAYAFKAAQTVNFEIEGGASEADGQLRIFEVGPAGTCTGKVSIAQEEWLNCKSDGDGHADCGAPVPWSSSSSSIRSSSSTYYSNSPVNMGLWFNGSNWQVETGGDCLYEYGECEKTTMGIWYDYDDRKNDHGGSYAIYPYDTMGYYNPLKPYPYGFYIIPEIENLGYVTIKYHLADPTITGQEAEYPYNYVGLGFNLVNGAKDPLDITPTGGLCVTYTSDNAITLEIENATSGDAACSVTLTKAKIPTMVSKTIVDFKQPTWAPAANKLSSCAEAFKAAQSVKFKLDGGASEADGQLRIFEVGPAGTCTGKVSIAQEEWLNCKSDGDGHADCGAPVPWSSSSSSIRSSSSSTPIIIWPTYSSSSSAINYKEMCELVTKKDSTYFVCEGKTVYKVYSGTPTCPEVNETKTACEIGKGDSGYNVVCNDKVVGIIKNSSKSSKISCVETETSFVCTIKDSDKSASNGRPSTSLELFSVTINGRIVSLNGFGGSVYYRLFDMQGNTVESGYAAGSINFSDMKTGNYVLKVKGDIELTKKIVLE